MCPHTPVSFVTTTRQPVLPCVCAKRVASLLSRTSADCCLGCTCCTCTPACCSSWLLNRPPVQQWQQHGTQTGTQHAVLCVAVDTKQHVPLSTQLCVGRTKFLAGGWVGVADHCWWLLETKAAQHSLEFAHCWQQSGVAWSDVVQIPQHGSRCPAVEVEHVVVGCCLLMMMRHSCWSGVGVAAAGVACSCEQRVLALGGAQQHFAAASAAVNWHHCWGAFRRETQLG